MRRFYHLLAMGCLGLLLAACAASTAGLEPQNIPLGARQARLYFLRKPTLLGRTGVAVDIQVDGQSIGTLAPGSILIADREAGQHTIAVTGIGDSTGFETDVLSAPGKSYHFEVGPTGRLNAEELASELMGSKGRPLHGRNEENARFMFYFLDAAAGAAAVAKLQEK
jgi:hypothetical protein